MVRSCGWPSLFWPWFVWLVGARCCGGCFGLFVDVDLKIFGREMTLMFDAFEGVHIKNYF